ncbi:MAG: type II secretion system protein N [Pseudomonadota bacterium]
MIGGAFCITHNDKILWSTPLLLSAPPRRLQRHAPLLLGVLLIVAMSVSLAWQTLGWIRLVRTPPASVGAPPPSDVRQAAAPTQLAALFGPAAVGQGNGPPPATDLRLTLHGSFVNADPQRSSAIVQREGSKPQRFVIGSELADGIRLHAVYRDRIELERQGRLETLPFPTSRQSQSSAYVEAPQYDEPMDQLGNLEEENAALLRERMEALRQQMEAAGSQPVDDLTDQNLESD